MSAGLLLLAGGGAALAAALFVASQVGAPMFRPGRPLPPAPAAEVLPDRFRVGGFDLSYQSQGAGKPVLVVHGGPGFPFQEPWAALDGLAGYRFVYYDQRGCGLSTRPFERPAGNNPLSKMKRVESSLGLGANLSDIESIRQGLGVERLSLIGHSFGGFIAAAYAWTYPQRVEKLVLVAPAPVVKMPMDGENLFDTVAARLGDAADKAAYAAWLKENFDFLGMMKRTDAELAAHNRRLLEFLAKAAGFPPVDPAQLDRAPRPCAGFGVPALYLSLGRAHDWRRHLARITAPCLVCTGDRDIFCPEQSVRAHYGSSLPRARWESFAACGHFIFDEKRAELRGLVGQFLADPA